MEVLEGTWWRVHSPIATTEHDLWTVSIVLWKAYTVRELTDVTDVCICEGLVDAQTCWVDVLRDCRRVHHDTVLCMQYFPEFEWESKENDESEWEVKSSKMYHGLTRIDRA